MSSEVMKQDKLLTTLQCLLQLPATNVADTFQQTAQLITQALDAEKVDVFLYDPDTESLIAYGTSATPLGKKEISIGLDRLPLSSGGRVVEVYQTGQVYWTGQAQHDPEELSGMKEDLGIKSEILVPLSVHDERRGVLLVSSRGAHYFTRHDLPFLEAITQWVGVILHRAELVEQHTREAAEQAKCTAAEEILTVMAHDLRNYLTPLKMRLDLLERRACRDQQDAYVRELQAVDLIVSRLSRLIANLLDVSRLKQGLFALHCQSVDLVALVEELVPIWHTLEHPIEMQIPERLILMADRDRLAQIIENLLSNAATYAEPQTPIRISLTQEPHIDGPWVILMVSNRGLPIPPEHLASLFQPFTKGDHSQGLGLGLWVSQRIAQAHQGALTAHTEATGTNHFTLSLPLQCNEPGQEVS
ncbi:GAF domain-containing sensor histidine kinase [Ktedonospora formicarum]|uniref:histidine kinase n=1 Tax=Ktedonospora formicarum TaxID=2778364 RepID=A0A8J3IA76_9CHLR|nr:GAF domain-containing sensor histidine kinase [Ktedonospora formicarum]GHO48877.1 hypothetical protein KSX_70400 [Ktedonospora formicarum]